jgi:hypothetical protein
MTFKINFNFCLRKLSFGFFPLASSFPDINMLDVYHSHNILLSWEYKQVLFLFIVIMFFVCSFALGLCCNGQSRGSIP